MMSGFMDEPSSPSSSWQDIGDMHDEDLIPGGQSRIVEVFEDEEDTLMAVKMDQSEDDMDVAFGSIHYDDSDDEEMAPLVDSSDEDEDKTPAINDDSDDDSSDDEDL